MRCSGPQYLSACSKIDHKQRGNSQCQMEDQVFLVISQSENKWTNKQNETEKQFQKLLICLGKIRARLSDAVLLATWRALSAAILPYVNWALQKLLTKYLHLKHILCPVENTRFSPFKKLTEICYKGANAKNCINYSFGINGLFKTTLWYGRDFSHPPLLTFTLQCL